MSLVVCWVIHDGVKVLKYSDFEKYTSYLQKIFKVVQRIMFQLIRFSELIPLLMEIRCIYRKCN